ncbi:unnamed protein product [[Actinomadura] parvosata subsp. kistnae]|uniref:Uncharacterized protein n=1 Tax=[Actinomadura] parvosata subsp. kistnae TaxID=1909395 RepID=A0A1V0AGG0_9ACTN|nr:hypothetical protein [Nonomuraea sp. ATCC 55076]AQZ69290.1 hypothetical protein BKM31_54510 [Nonomuraea sp. ATCC 55076]SPL92080.1 unnamed protein product [Actinomadura parvosata subsp. kistnae]
MRVHLAVLAAVTILPCAALPALTVLPASAAATVSYECTTKATGEKQEVGLDVELTVPAQATVGQQMTIGWSGVFVTGKELTAPATGMEGELNMYVYAGISGIDDLTSATGVAELGTVIPGEPVAIPSTATMTTTPRKSGSGTVHAGAINFGLTPQDRLVECEVKNKDSLTQYPFTVLGADGSTPTTTDTSTTGTSTTGTPTPEASEDDTGSEEQESPATTDSADIPAGGVDTGAGGLAGPDGRALVLTGLVITLAAATGLRLRRPRPRTHQGPDTGP